MNENTKTTATATCKWCGVSLSPAHKGPCPKCGKEGKKIVVEIKDSIRLRDSLNWERRREFFKKNPKIKWLTIAITFVVSPLLGFVLSILAGVVFGIIITIILAALSYLLGPFAVTKIREIVRGSS